MAIKLFLASAFGSLFSLIGVILSIIFAIIALKLKKLPKSLLWNW